MPETFTYYKMHCILVLFWPISMHFTLAFLALSSRAPDHRPSDVPSHPDPDQVPIQGNIQIPRSKSTSSAAHMCAIKGG